MPFSLLAVGACCATPLRFHPVAAGLLAADILDEAFFLQLGEDTVDGGKGGVEVIHDIGALAVGMGLDKLKNALGVLFLLHL